MIESERREEEERRKEEEMRRALREELERGEERAREAFARRARIGRTETGGLRYMPCEHIRCLMSDV
jgi:hypothetical protein